nr:hypothetical protein [Tanacetum cinerariifolium]
MTKLVLNECMEKAQTESNLSITISNNDMNIELGKEFLTELQNNAYHGMLNEDVVDHIAKLDTTKEKAKSLALKAKVTREQTSDDSDDQGGRNEDVDEEEAEALMARNFRKVAVKNKE